MQSGDVVRVKVDVDWTSFPACPKTNDVGVVAHVSDADKHDEYPVRVVFVQYTHRAEDKGWEFNADELEVLTAP